ncbi:MAG: FtsH protease activity modulator HflK [Candidatus Lernaella stagnicola]|nr:FtsH protease activity modulator HflK [Candidatus Lernaella stagnicola]
MNKPPAGLDVRLIQNAVRFWRTRRAVVLAAAAVVVLVLYLASGIYTVPTNQTAALYRFGKLVSDDIASGIHLRLPAPIHRVAMVNTSEVRRMTLKSQTLRTVSMVSGDENLIEVDVAVQYQISDFRRYLTGAEDWDKVIAQSIAAVLGNQLAEMPVDEILTTGKSRIQVALRGAMQQTLEKYGAGLTVISTRLVSIIPPAEAAASFRKVADAKSEKAKRINEAQSKRNQAMSQSRGEAEKVIQESRSTADERVKRAEGDAERFLAILAEYRLARQVTRTDLYLKNMEKVIQRAVVLLHDPRFALDLNLFGPAGGAKAGK